MAFTILCTFRRGAYAEAKQRRLEHYEFLRRERNNIAEGGPLLGPDGLPSAMLIVVERETAEAAQVFIAGEPYTKAGLFESVAVHQWCRVIPEPRPDYIDSGYANELAARSAR